MSITRRRFVQTTALAATAAYAVPAAAQRGAQAGPATPVPDSMAREITTLTEDIRVWQEDEWTNFVRANKTRLAPGMCFSDEPMVAIYGEFGIRLGDCLYLTDNGPKFFTQQSMAIDRTFA
jgi:Xaa-Pro aminopeptidase